MQWFYIRFNYRPWEQGYDNITETLLVEAVDFESGCELIREQVKYKYAKYFKDLTLRKK